MKSISTIIQSIDFDYSFKLMALLDRIRRGDSLDELLHDYSFVFVYEIVKSHTVKDRKKGISATLANNSRTLFNQMREQYPIDIFPEKYI